MTSLQVPNVEEQLNDVTNAINDINFDELVEEGRNTFNEIRTNINDTVNANVNGEYKLVFSSEYSRTSQSSKSLDCYQFVNAHLRELCELNCLHAFCLSYACKHLSL